MTFNRLRLCLSVLLFIALPAAAQQNAPQSAASLTNSVGMQFVLIPAGDFIMGSPYDEKGRQEDETPHQVTLTRAFYIGVTEVTQGQWHKVMGYNRSQFKGDSLPVEKITWKEAVEFCQKLSQMENKVYRLPTEAEWEYACRAGSAVAFAGNNCADCLAWYAANSNEHSHPVAEKFSNAWGVFDMHGNVSEWCADFYSPEYPDSAVTDPTGPADGKQYVIRGGAWDTFLPGCRSAARSSAPASYQFKQTGFRVVMEVDNSAGGQK